MNASKTAQLESALLALSAKWGAGIVRPLTEVNSAPAGIATGFPALDALLAPALVPTGQLTELFGQPTSGMTTFAYRLIAQAQGSARYAIYIDLEGTFDPAYAAGTGIALDRMLLARPESDLHALELARDLLQAGSIGIIVLDIGHLAPGQDRLYRLTAFLLHAQCALLRMEMLGADRRALNHSSPAALRLLLERLAWIEQDGDIIGCRSALHILKSLRGMGQQVPLDLQFEPYFGEASA